MKVLVIGAGATGSIIAKLLAQESEVEQVICADVNLKRARKFIIPDTKLVFKEIDASKKEEVLKIIDGADLLINAATPMFNKLFLEIALEKGINYQDLASWEKGRSEQLDYDVRFASKNLIGLVNASASPGVTNLLVGELASKFKRIDSIKIRLLEDVNSDVPFTPWSKEVAFNEFAVRPVTWENDRYVSYNNFANEEFYNFGDPFTNEKCYLISQEEIETIPKYIKAKHIDIKIGGSEARSVRMFYRLGLMRNKPMKIGNSIISPYDVLVKVWPDVLGISAMKKLAASGKLINANFWAAVEIYGVSKKDSRKAAIKAFIRFPSERDVNKLYPGANHVSYAAGLAAVVFALNLSKVSRKGVFAPEAIDMKVREGIIKKLKERGVKIGILEE